MRNSSSAPLVWPLALALAHAAGAVTLAAQERLTPGETRIARRVDEGVDSAIELLRRTVDINSGTLNAAGVRAVADALAPELERLGFDVRWSPLPAGTERAGHLIAERSGSRGRRLLLIGHLDTVFEPDSPFQTFERDGDVARGPGVSDMKGGNVVMLLALEALHAEGALDDTSMIVVLTGDEEAPARPLDVARRDLLDAADRSDVALGFEAGSRVGGVDMAVVARRSASQWRLEVRARTAHSSVIFQDEVGVGAVYETARILEAWHDELRGEEHLTFNVGLILGGSDVHLDAHGVSGTAEGKTNVIPASVVATGDVRTISEEQLRSARERMRRIVARSRPGAEAVITFTDGYPAMSPTEANYALLARYDEVSRALGHGPVEAFDPGARGAADISFVADRVEAGLDGLGPVGDASHTVEEKLDLPSIPVAAKRAAILIHRLTR